jgi:dTDP-L-rhamnose 4-epimerase
MKPIRNILVTGGAGFIGSNLSLSLLNRGYGVTVLDNLSPQVHGDCPHVTSPLYRSVEGKVRFVHGCVTSRAAWEEALHDVDAVVHLAAETGTGQSMYEIQRYTQTNIGGTALLLDLLAGAAHRVRRLAVASSRAVYGEGKYLCTACGVVFPGARKDADMAHGDFECKCPRCGGSLTLQPTSEDSRLAPTSVYGITKQMQEQLVMTVCPTLGIDPVVFRYQNVYGPGQSLANPYTGILSIFSTRIKNGHEINLFEDGRESRDFVYIDDVVNATVLGMEREEAASHVLNVGTGAPVDVATVARELQKCYGANVPLRISGSYRLGDIRHCYADTTVTRQTLGFAPKVSFAEGVRRFAEWVNLQPLQHDRYEKAIEEMKQKGMYK